MTPRAVLVLTPGVFYEQTWYRSTKRCHIPNLYAIQFQRGQILKMGFFVPMFQLVTHGVGPVLTPGASYEQTWWRSSRRCYIPNIKALGLPLSEKNYEIFFLCSYVPTCDPRGRPSFDPRGII